ncbi:IS110 family transposase [Membranicola marinus]|uniref:IS110 family transposase n=1 Tax=Membranihabitans marinus TaxID=1227546 RepID=A0A953I0S7_9BACT|nr:transposase [Membranihabitans marinus]MBY5960301.1 IS110 family transposase [Membranihabitans marinus]
MSKLIIGLDIAKDDFKACIQSQMPDGEIKIKGSRTFKNTSVGYAELVEWTEMRIKTYHDFILFVMEATGVYYEDLAYYLYENDHHISVLLPNKVKHFTKSLNIVSKTDKIDARIIAQIGIERKLKCWKPMCPQYKELKALNRKRLSLDKEKKRAKNQLHAMNHAHKTSESVIGVTKKQIEFYQHQIQVLEEQVEAVIKSNPELD